MVEQVPERLIVAMSESRDPSWDRMATRPATRLALAALIVLGAAPLVATVAFSFMPLDGGMIGVDLAGYTAALEAGRLDEIVQVTLRAAIATLVSVAIGLPAAYHLKQLSSPRVQLLLLALLLAPWLVSDMLRAFGWQLALSPSGFVSAAWSAVSGDGPLEGLRYNRTATIVGLVSATVPTSILCTFAALPRPNSSEWQAARELGAPGHVFRLMVFGRARLGVTFGACFTFLLCLFASAEPQFLGGPTRSSMRTIASSLANVGVSALMALGVLILLLATAVMLLFLLAWLGHRRPRGAGGLPAESVTLPMSPFSFARPRSGAQMSDLAVASLPAACTWAALLLTLCPIAAISLEAFRQPTPDGSVWTLANFGLLLDSTELLSALGRSATLALAVSVVATAVGFALGLASWAPARARRILLAMLVLALLPGEVFSLGLLQVAKLAGFDEGAPPLAGMAQIVWIVPFTTISLMLANLSIGRSVIESALELGRTPNRIATEVVSRINWSAIAASAIFAFTLSLNENTRVSYLGGSQPALANEVFGRLQAGLLPSERGIFAIEFLLVAAALVSAVLILNVLFRASQKALD